MFVAFLTTMLVGSVESELKATVKQVRAIADQLSFVTLSVQRLTNVVGTALVDRLPSVMRPAENAGRQIRSVWDSRKARSVEIRDVGRVRFAKPIEIRRSHGAFSVVE